MQCSGRETVVSDRALFYFMQKTSSEMLRGRVGSEMCIRGSALRNCVAQAGRVHGRVSRTGPPQQRCVLVVAAAPPRQGLEDRRGRAHEACRLRLSYTSAHADYEEYVGPGCRRFMTAHRDTAHQPHAARAESLCTTLI